MRSTLTHAAALILSATLATVSPAQLPQWRLVEDLRIGTDGSEMTTFTDVRSIVEGADGKIFVLDARPQEIRVFDRSGKFLSLAARRGKGPGEITNANGLLRLGDAIWANDPSNSRFPAYSAADGKYLRQINIPIRGYRYTWGASGDAQGRIVEWVSVQSGRTDPATGRPISEARYRRVRTDGTGADTIAAPVCLPRNIPAQTSFTGSGPGPLNAFYGIPFLAMPIVTLDGRGGYWCAPNDEYLLVHRSLASNDSLHAFRMPYTRLPVSAEQRTAEIERVKKGLAEYQVIVADYSLVPTIHPVFVRLDVDGKGQLWATRVKRPDAPWTFDVYDQSGRALATVTTTVAFNAGRPLYFTGDHVYGVVNDSDDVPYIVRARLVR
jgi:hypothetical protein